MTKGPKKPPTGGGMKRMTIDIPADLHKRMKLECVRRERDMADVIREQLEKLFPAKP